MAKGPFLEVLNAHYVGLRIHQGTEVVDLDFVKDGGGSTKHRPQAPIVTGNRKEMPDGL